MTGGLQSQSTYHLFSNESEAKLNFMYGMRKFSIAIADSTNGAPMNSDGFAVMTNKPEANLNVQYNYWGEANGPGGDNITNGVGTGSAPPKTDKIDLSQLITCKDRDYCTTFFNTVECTSATALWDPQSSQCVKDAVSCTRNGYGNFASAAQECVVQCPSKYVIETNTCVETCPESYILIGTK